MSSVVADSGPNAGSNLVHGVGTNAVTFTLPGSPRYKVESVVASVDNTAGGDTTGTLTVADQSGQVVAAVEQGRVLSAGVTGRATWALRLAAETLGVGDSANVAHARFTGPEIEAGATKKLVPAIAGTIIIPLDFYLVPSADFNWSEDVPGGSTAALESPPSHEWANFPFQGLGVTQWVSLSQMVGDPNIDGIERGLIGCHLDTFITPGPGLTVEAGTLEMFSRWYRVRITN